MEKLNSWLSLVANLAVVGGIVFLALEVRQNSDALSASTYQSMAIEQAQFNQNFMNREIAQILAAIDSGGFEDLSPVQRYQLNGLDNAYLFLQQNPYFQYTNGHLPESSWESRRQAMLEVFGSENMLLHWERRSFAFDQNFQRYVNEEIIPFVTSAMD